MPGGAEGVGTTAADDVATATDMWGVLGRDLWRPWPQADVVVHTGSQASLGVHVGDCLALGRAGVVVMAAIAVVAVTGAAGVEWLVTIKQASLPRPS